jgi:hypothetical protein
MIMKAKEMKLSFKKLRDEEGSIMLVALFILVILTLIGIMATTTSEIEIKIAGNDKFHKIAFHHADSGVFSTPKLISTSFDSGAEPPPSGFAYLGTSGTFYREIMGFDPHDAARDIRFTLNGLNVDVDVNRIGKVTLPGGSTEFGTGAEGLGGGSSGGIGILYGMDSLGEGPSDSLSNVDAVYRKVIGVPGGL